MASYSYKPASGLEGASTVVPLCDGNFLEVRRGEKTCWASGEIRRRWASLEEWKAELPEGATVVERTGRPSRRRIPTHSDDFKKALHVYCPLGERIPKSANLTVCTNRSESNKHYANSCKYHTCSNYVTHHQYKYYCDLAASEKKKSEEILASPPFKQWYCPRVYKHVGRISQTIRAQRISDGVFVPIFFDMKRSLLHTPDPGDSTGRSIVGKTFAELGVRPVFLRNESDGLRLITLEESVSGATGGGSATSS